MAKQTNDDKLLMSILKQNQELVEQYISKSKRENIDYDENFDSISRKNISNRDDSYTELLKHFVNITKNRNIIKEIHKWIYFWIIMLLIIGFGVLISLVISKIDITNTNTTNNLVIIISAFVSFASVLISIPLIITKYLFSSKEDKRIADIILHTQTHDLDGKRILENLKHLDNKINQLNQKESATIWTPDSNELIDLVNKTVEAASQGIQRESDNDAEENEA